MGMGELAPNFRNAETSKVFDFGTQWHSSCWKIHIFYELLIFSFGYKLMPRTAHYTCNHHGERGTDFIPRG